MEEKALAASNNDHHHDVESVAVQTIVANNRAYLSDVANIFSVALTLPTIQSEMRFPPVPATCSSILTARSKPAPLDAYHKEVFEKDRPIPDSDHDPIDTTAHVSNNHRRSSKKKSKHKYHVATGFWARKPNIIRHSIVFAYRLPPSAKMLSRGMLRKLNKHMETLIQLDVYTRATKIRSLSEVLALEKRMYSACQTFYQTSSPSTIRGYRLVKTTAAMYFDMIQRKHVHHTLAEQRDLEAMTVTWNAHHPVPQWMRNFPLRHLFGQRHNSLRPLVSILTKAAQREEQGLLPTRCFNDLCDTFSRVFIIILLQFYGFVHQRFYERDPSQGPDDYSAANPPYLLLLYLDYDAWKHIVCTHGHHTTKLPTGTGGFGKSVIAALNENKEWQPTMYLGNATKEDLAKHAAAVPFSILAIQLAEVFTNQLQEFAMLSPTSASMVYNAIIDRIAKGLQQRGVAFLGDARFLHVDIGDEIVSAVRAAVLVKCARQTSLYPVNECVRMFITSKLSTKTITRNAGDSSLVWRFYPWLVYHSYFSPYAPAIECGLEDFQDFAVECKFESYSPAFYERYFLRCSCYLTKELIDHLDQVCKKVVGRHSRAYQEHRSFLRAHQECLLPMHHGEIGNGNGTRHHHLQLLQRKAITLHQMRYTVFVRPTAPHVVPCVPLKYYAVRKPGINDGYSKTAPLDPSMAFHWLHEDLLKLPVEKGSGAAIMHPVLALTLPQVEAATLYRTRPPPLRMVHPKTHQYPNRLHLAQAEASSSDPFPPLLTYYEVRGDAIDVEGNRAWLEQKYGFSEIGQGAQNGYVLEPLFNQWWIHVRCLPPAGIGDADKNPEYTRILYERSLQICRIITNVQMYAVDDSGNWIAPSCAQDFIYHVYILLSFFLRKEEDILYELYQLWLPSPGSGGSSEDKRKQYVFGLWDGIIVGCYQQMRTACRHVEEARLNHFLFDDMDDTAYSFMSRCQDSDADANGNEDTKQAIVPFASSPDSRDVTSAIVLSPFTAKLRRFTRHLLCSWNGCQLAYPFFSLHVWKELLSMSTVMAGWMESVRMFTNADADANSESYPLEYIAASLCSGGEDMKEKDECFNEEMLWQKLRERNLFLVINKIPKTQKYTALTWRRNKHMVKELVIQDPLLQRALRTAYEDSSKLQALHLTALTEADRFVKPDDLIELFHSTIESIVVPTITTAYAHLMPPDPIRVEVAHVVAGAQMLSTYPNWMSARDARPTLEYRLQRVFHTIQTSLNALMREEVLAAKADLALAKQQNCQTMELDQINDDEEEEEEKKERLCNDHDLIRATHTILALLPTESKESEFLHEHLPLSLLNAIPSAAGSAAAPVAPSTNRMKRERS